MITDIINNPVDLYVLTDAGDLGFFATNDEFQIDQEATAVLQTRSLDLAFLRDHLAHNETNQVRVGVVGCASSVREWGRTSLFLEESVVRDLYPVSGSASAGPTTFQRKNQEKSLYRGMELLLEYRRVEYPDAPVYCPVLFDRGTTLNRYPGIAACVTPENATTPALDILNLVSVVPTVQRDVAIFNTLKARLHSVLIRKEQRRTRHLEVLHHPHNPPAVKTPTHDPYANADRRMEPPIALTGKGLDKLRTPQHIGLTEQWHEVQRQENAGTLRTFVHFHEAEIETLRLIAAKASLYTALPGTRLLEQGMTNPWNLYLLEGSLLLASNDGITITVEAGTAAAKNPIAFLRPRKYTVTALTNVSFWWIHDTVLKAAGVGV